VHTTLIWFEIETYGEPRSHVSNVVFTPCDNLMCLLMKPWHVLLNKTPSKRVKEEQRERTQVRTRSTKTQSGSHRGIGKNYVPKPPPIARSILEKGREGT
jgi:hypothetical protein